MRISKPFFRTLGPGAIASALGLVLLVFFAVPLFTLLTRSLGFPAGKTAPGLSVFRAVLADPGFSKALGNSLRVSLGVTILTTLIAGSLAWLVVKTDFPYKKAVARSALLTFIVPSYILGVAWIQLLGKNGYLHRFLNTLGFTADLAGFCYSMEAVTLVLTIHLYPLAFFALKNALERQDPSLEHAAVLAGASPLRVIRTVTAPLALPSAVSIGLLTFSRTLANFEIPALLALPVRKELLTTRVYIALNNLNLNAAAALSLLLVAVSALIFAASSRVLGRETDRRISESDGASYIHPLGKAKTPAVVLTTVFQTAVTVLPLLTLVISSFLKRWGLPLRREYFTLQNYIQLLFQNEQAALAFRNSIMYGAAGASLAVLIALSLSFFKPRNGTVRKSLEVISSWPMAAPNIVLAIAAILSWSRPPVALYGTHGCIIAAYMVLFTPIIQKNIRGLQETMDPAPLAAARVFGAGPIRSFWDITLPGLLPGIKTGWLFCFLIALREIPISLLLYSTRQDTVGVLLFGMQSQSYGLEMISTLAIVILIILGAGNFLLSMIKAGARNAGIENRASE